MKHFSSDVNQSTTYVVNSDMSFTDPDFVRCQLALIVAMDANPDDMTLNEERVIADFISWFKECKEDETLNGSYPTRPIHVYVNLKQGFTCVFVCTDAKGKLRIAPY